MELILYRDTKIGKRSTMKLANRHLDENRAGQSSRRRFLKGGAAFAVAPFLRSEGEAGQRLPNADDAGTLERLWRQSTAPNQYILLRGGTVVTMDPKVGDFVRADVLIQGKKISAVGGELKAPPQA